MTQHQSTVLGRSVARFFQNYLPTLRGMSPHTIRSYRDTMVLFLRFAAVETGGSVEKLGVYDINADRLCSFLTSLEMERGNSIATRNARLAAIHSFARFLIAEHPEHMNSLQQVVGLPFRRGGAGCTGRISRRGRDQRRPGERQPQHAVRASGLRAVLTDVQYRRAGSGNTGPSRARSPPAIALPGSLARQRQQDPALPHLATRGTAPAGAHRYTSLLRQSD